MPAFAAMFEERVAAIPVVRKNRRLRVRSAETKAEKARRGPRKS